MTEHEWNTCADPAAMLKHLRRERKAKPSERKLRLFACACCRRVRSTMKNKSLTLAVETAEQYADGIADDLRLLGAYGRAWEVVGGGTVVRTRPAVLAASDEVSDLYAVAGSAAALAKDPSSEAAAQAALVRDIFRPFRPVTFDDAWRTADALTVALQMYEGRDFAAVPVLADALQDAGCEDAVVLGHCRNPGPHVRGCWVVDLVLGNGGRP